MFATIGTWFAGQAASLAAKEIPWKWIGVGLLAFAVALTIGLGYLHVQGLQKDLVKTTAELAEQRQLVQLEKARSTAIIAEHDTQVERINALENQRSTIAVEVTALRQQVQEMDIEDDIAGDNEEKAQAAVAALNSRAADLDRRLRDVSAAKGGIRPGQDPGSKAGKARAPGLVERALQALRH